MIYEFLGLPGSGKTTLARKCKQIIPEIRLPFKIWGSKKLRHRIIRKLKKISCRIKYAKEYKTCLELLGNKSNIVNPSIKIKDTLIYLFVFADIYRNTKPNEIVLMEEGIIHYLAVLMAEYDIEGELVFSIYKKIFVKYCNMVDSVFYIDVSIDVVLKQIEQRNRHTCYIDELNSDNLQFLLNRYRKSMDFFEQALSKKIYIHEGQEDLSNLLRRIKK